MTSQLPQTSLDRLPRANIVEFILSGVKKMVQDIRVNTLDERIGIIWQDPARKTHLRNVINALGSLISECANDPAGKVIYDASMVRDVLQGLLVHFEEDKTHWKSWVVQLHAKNVRTPTTTHEVNLILRDIIHYLDNIRHLMHTRLYVPRGNLHTRECYNPEYAKTYTFKPADLPSDYRSNFFMEVYIKELCPYTAAILFHQYNNVQAPIQESRSTEELINVNTSVDPAVMEDVDHADNIRIMRVHGPKDDRTYPGSYLVLKGEHHRTRALYLRFVEGKLSGDYKILVQRMLPAQFSKEHMQKVSAEIISREALRNRFDADILRAQNEGRCH